MPSFNIYVPSYGRYENILTEKHLEYCTYVVRKSEEEAYRNAGVSSIWAVDDELINSVNKVSNFIIDNSPEDIICIIDDDVKQVCYRLDALDKIFDTETITKELERLAQVIYDLSIGYLACPSDSNVKFYDRPFKFVGVNGGMKMFNKKVLKSRLNLSLKFLSDVDMQLTELLKNRIILMPNYFCFQCEIDTNKGGSNDNKRLSDFDAENEYMSQKWGRYYEKADGKSAGKIKVKR